MKKLIAILLSVLMLCSVIPFATVAVSAEEGINIIVEVSEEQVNAGDEFEVTVLLEGNPGLISADITLTYDPTAIELVGEWDGEEFYPEISSPRKWKANGFTYRVDDGLCVVQFVLGTASNITEEEYFTALFVAKDDAYTGDYSLTVSYDPANYFGRGEVDGTFDPVAILGVENGSISINGAEPTPPSCTHEYDNACDVDCNLCGEVREVEHNVAHVEAKDATCTELGNIEYWYCETCGAAWLDEAHTLNTNMMAVKLPMIDHTYDNDFDADCNACGAVREVAAFPVPVIGKSISEDVSGYAVLFDANVEGLELVDGAADYTNATYNGYKLLGLGVTASNGNSETTIEGVRVYGINDETGALQFAFRIINIPESGYGTEITMVPYYIVEIDGVATTIEGEAVVGSYAEIAG